MYLDIHIKNIHLEGKIWRHNQCSILIDFKKRCEKCNLLFQYLRMYKKKRSYNYGSNHISRKRKTLSLILLEEEIMSNSPIKDEMY